MSNPQIISGVAAAVQTHVLAAGGLFPTGTTLVQQTLFWIVAIGGGIAALIELAKRRTTKGFFFLITTALICDWIQDPSFYTGILHGIVTQLHL